MDPNPESSSGKQGELPRLPSLQKQVAKMKAEFFNSGKQIVIRFITVLVNGVSG
jgi:hypothetical protein